MEKRNRCYGCMEKKTEKNKCPYCGWIDNSGPTSPLHLSPGTILQEKYLVGKALGQGGFGITYLAWDLNLELKQALKEFFPQGLVSRVPGKSMVVTSPDSVNNQFNYGLEKFINEAKTLAHFVEHPNIVSVRDFFYANSTAYVVMHYIEGLTLEDYLKQVGGKISFAKTIDIIFPVLDALREVHQRGVLHRDISPDNIYINKDGRVVLIDFGAARQEFSKQSRGLSVIMKAGYSPEEQYRSKGEQGAWTDIYAVAATIYRSITGEIPPESLDRLEEDSLILPSQLGITIERCQEQVLLKALAVRAKNRYQSVEEFQADLIGNKLIDSNLSLEKNNIAPNRTVSTRSEKKFESDAEQLKSRQAGNTTGNIINSGLVAQKGEWIFYSNKMISGGLYKVRIDGSDKSFISDQHMLYINIVDQWIYFINPRNSKVYKIKSDGSFCSCISEDRATNLFVVGNWAYYINRDLKNMIYMIGVDNKNYPKRINKESTSEFNVLGDWTYYINENDGARIYKLSNNSNEPIKVNDVRSQFINVTENCIYYSNSSCGNAIFKANLDGSNDRRVNIDDSKCLNVCGQWIYYCNRNDGYKIYKIRTDGSDRTRINDDDSYCLNVVGDWVYYRNRDDGFKMYRMRSEGSVRQKVE